MKYSAKANTLCAQPCYPCKAVGNKTCVLALTKFWKEAIKNWGGEEKFSAVIQGFNLHGEGKVDSIEVLEWFSGLRETAIRYVTNSHADQP